MNLTVGYWAPGRLRSLPQHHNNGLELVLVEKGQTEWSVDGEPEWLAPGSIFFTLPWQQHGDVHDQRQGLELYYIILPLDQDYRHYSETWQFDPALRLGFDDAEATHIRQRIMALRQHAWPATQACRRAMRQAVYECQHTDLFSEKERGNMLSSLLIHFLRSTTGMNPQHSADSEVQVQRFIESLQARCHEQWTLQSMAAACGLERTQFSTYVQKVSGLSPKQLLNHLRIKRACALLESSKDAITHIALDCGFDSSQYFARVFKQHTGMDARSYRLMHA